MESWQTDILAALEADSEGLESAQGKIAKAYGAAITCHFFWAWPWRSLDPRLDSPDSKWCSTATHSGFPASPQALSACVSPSSMGNRNPVGVNPGE